jgi:hypothetical protein
MLRVVIASEEDPMLKSIVKGVLAATATGVTVAAMLSLPEAARAESAPTARAAQPSASANVATAGRTTLSARQRKTLRRKLRRKAAADFARSVGLTANNELVIVTGDHWESSGCVQPQYEPAGSYWYSFCLYQLVRGNSGYVLQHHVDYYWWNGRQWSFWYSQDS